MNLQEPEDWPPVSVLGSPVRELSAQAIWDARQAGLSEERRARAMQEVSISVVVDEAVSI